MTANGAIVFFLLATTTIFVPTRDIVPVFGSILIVTFTLWTGWRHALCAVRSALFLCTPFFGFLYLVWVVIVNSSPGSSPFMLDSITLTPLQYVIAVSSRLFLFSLLAFALVERFSSGGFLLFVTCLSAPQWLKVLLLVTMSLRSTLLQAASRAHTALIAANVLIPGISFRNAKAGWRLAQAIWVAALGIAMERLDTKWRYERLPRAATVSRDVTAPILEFADFMWIAGAAITTLLAFAIPGSSAG